MIDSSCHILPGMDDGPSNLNEAIAMAKKATAQGIHTIIATPHHNNGTYINEKDAIIGATDFVNAKLQQENIALMLLPGQKTRIYPDLVHDLKHGLILPLNQTTGYVLIELHANHIPPYTIQHVFDMQIAGYIPIIAQPEENDSVLENPNQLYNIVKNGALLQLGASSIIGAKGKKVEKVAQQLLDANMVHFIASNAHNAKKQGFHLKKAYGKLGTDHEQVLKENSELVIHGRSIIKDAPSHITKRGIWNRWK